ncbi:MAG: tetratricopeptide repeat protein [Bacteroidota bacterium]
MPIIRTSPHPAFCFFSILVLLLFSCNNPFPSQHQDKQDRISYGLTSLKARLFAPKQPDSALLYADSALRLMDSLVCGVSPEALVDSQLVEYLDLRANALIKLDMRDSAYSFMQHFLRETHPGRSNVAKIHSGLWLAQQLTNDGKYFLARKYLDETFPLFDNKGQNYQKAIALNIEGSLLSSTGDYLNAQKKLLEAIKIFESLGDNKVLGPVYLNLAGNYQSLNDKKLSLLYYRKACSITTAYHDSLNYLFVLNNLGTYYRISNPDSAEYYFSKAKNLLPMKQFVVETLPTRFHLAGLYYEQKKYTQALELYNEVLSVSQKQHINSGVFRAMSGIGNVYEAQNRDQDALRIFQEAGRLAASSGEIPVYIELLEAEAYMYEKAGRNKEALITQKTIRHLSDSLLALDKQIAIHDLEFVYNNEKLERQNESLSTKMLMMKNRMQANFMLLFLALISVLVLGALLFRIYRLYHQRNSAYNILFEKYRNDIRAADSEEGIISAVQLFPPLIPGQSSQTYQKLIEYFESEKPYLNSNLKFDDVTGQLRINQKTISDLIQQHAGMSFKMFVNNYRIKEVLRLLASPELKNYKIEAVAKEAGFGSKTAFYKAFSQITGTRPSEFR